MLHISIIIFLVTPACNAILDYDRAIIQSQKNNWPATQELLTQIVVEQPNRPDALYDLGVASYKNNSFDAALSYFNKAAQHTSATSQLQQQSHFNAGNAHVQLKQLHEAIDAYDRVLAQNPNHKEALHNKEVVKKMLEQQKQDEKNNEQNKDEDKKENEDKQDQDKQNEDNKKDQKNKQDQSDKDNSKADKKKDSDKSDQKDKGSNQPDQSSNNNQQPSKDSGSQEPKANKKDDDQSADAKAQADKQNENKKSNGANPEQAKRSEGAEQSVDAKAMPDRKLSAGLARVLEDREKKDAQINKKMTKALVANQGGGKNDYNCW